MADRGPELKFFIEGIAPREHALVPALCMQLRALNATPEPVHSLLLRCQVQIDAPRRRYSPAEQQRLQPLFAEPARWEQTLRPLHWQTVTALVGAFTGTTVAEVELPCSLDFGLAATRYLAALEGDAVPLRVFFSGTAFFEGRAGVRVQPVDWNLEAVYRMRCCAWRQAIAACHGDTVWLPLRAATFERLLALRDASGHTSWDQTLAACTPRAEAA